jgi:hypothetical protein
MSRVPLFCYFDALAASSFVAQTEEVEEPVEAFFEDAAETDRYEDYDSCEDADDDSRYGAG